MALINENSSAAVSSDLDIFSVTPTQVGALSGYYTEIAPLSNDYISNLESAIEFTVIPGVEQYIDLSKTIMYVKAKVVKSNGENLEDADSKKCALINAGIHSLFSSGELYLNDVLISEPISKSYVYKAYISTLLNATKSHKDTLGQANLYYKDTSKNITDNKGYISRAERIALSKTFEMIDYLQFDFMKQSRYLINQVGMKLRFHPNQQSFILWTDGTDYKLKLLEVKLLVRYVNVEPKLLLEHQKILDKGVTCKYVFDRVSQRQFQLSVGDLSKHFENLFLNKVPAQILICLVSSAAFNGSLNTNPFYFGHYNLSNIRLAVDNIPIPRAPQKLNFEGNIYLEAYHNLFRSLNYTDIDDSNIDLTINDFKNGYSIFCFSTSPELRESPNLNLLRQGNVSLTLTFSAALTEAVTAIIFSTSPSLVEINAERHVTHDFTA